VTSRNCQINIEHGRFIGDAMFVSDRRASDFVYICARRIEFAYFCDFLVAFTNS